jgi:hypothetical protein
MIKVIDSIDSQTILNEFNRLEKDIVWLNVPSKKQSGLQYCIGEDMWLGATGKSHASESRFNELNPLYKGWGNEDEDLRERFKWAGYTPKRNEVGTFYCLYHEDNGDISSKPIEQQQDFIEGRKIYTNAFEYRHIGYKNVKADVEEFETGIDNVRWIKSTNYKIIQ